MLTLLIAQAAETTDSSGDGSGAFGGMLCIGIICLLCYLAGKTKKPKGFDEFAYRRVKPHK